MTTKMIMDMAKKAEGRRRTRKVTEQDTEKAIEIINTGLYKAFVVHCGDFVPNSYKYRCDMSVIRGVLTDSGWKVTVGRSDAKRSGGRGPWATAVKIEHADGSYRAV